MPRHHGDHRSRSRSPKRHRHRRRDDSPPKNSSSQPPCALCGCTCRGSSSYIKVPPPSYAIATATSAAEVSCPAEQSPPAAAAAASSTFASSAPSPAAPPPKIRIQRFVFLDVTTSLPPGNHPRLFLSRRQALETFATSTGFSLAATVTLNSDELEALLKPKLLCYNLQLRCFRPRLTAEELTKFESVDLATQLAFIITPDAASAAARASIKKRKLLPVNDSVLSAPAG